MTEPLGTPEVCYSLLDQGIAHAAWLTDHRRQRKHGGAQEHQRNFAEGRVIMRLRYLGKSTQGGGSPTLYATDRNTYVVQGWKVEGQDNSMEIPHRLLQHIESGTYLGALMADTGRGSFVLSGQQATDAEALAQMDIPRHETCVEVPKKTEVWFGGVATE